MALRIAIDFGTATTCMATVPDPRSFVAQTIPFEDGNSIARTAVFLDRPESREVIVRSKSPVGRHPLGVFERAHTLFDEYWMSRREARTDGVKWASWEAQLREEALLLTHFKPELADNPARVPLRVPRPIWGRWDPMAQTQECDVVIEERALASPDPDTDDLVAATAAVLRHCAARALDLSPPGERISHLAVGIPSLAGSASDAERDRAAARRHEAVLLANIAADFGTSDFRFLPYGEAEAAAWSVDIESDSSEVFKVIIDVGAGTTDLALVRYVREKGRYRFAERICSDSLRYAGRDLNPVLAEVLKHNKEFRNGIAALDEVDKRAWQHVMWGEVENVKCGLTPIRSTHHVSFHEASAYLHDVNTDMDRIAHALKCTAYVSLSCMDPVVQALLGSVLRKEWLPKVSGFLDNCLEQIGGRRELLSVEQVGGAFRFPPLRAEVLKLLQQKAIPATSLQFRDDSGQAQTMVARGLARWVATVEG